MSRFVRLFSVCSVSAIALATLTGCGIGAADTTQSPIISPALSGRSMGGNAPMVGATIKMYATGVTPGDGSSVNTGYGVGTQIAEAQTIAGHSAGWDTDSNGAFSFAGGYDCPAGQFAYLVSSAGNPGAGINPNAVTVAALGRCEDLYTFGGGVYTGYKGNPITVSELTTVAAAYALGQFSSEVGSGAATQVLIGAPSTNNAASGSASTSAVAGLAHAFQNSLNLVNPTVSGYTANSTLPGNSSAVVPTALINAIANTIVACVNSTGGSATSSTVNDGSVCGKIFSATTIGSTPPADTWGALVNLAANPTLSGGGNTAVTTFLNLSTAQTTAYSPSLSTTGNSSLNDLSIAILYPQGMAGPNGQGLIFPMAGAVDLNDNYYIGNQSTTGGTAPSNIISLASNGTINGSTGNGANAKACEGISVDAIGNGYCANAAGSSSNEASHFTFTPSTGMPATTLATLTTTANALNVKPNYTAVDAANNVWVVGIITNSGTSTVLKSAPGGASFSPVAATSAPVIATGVTGLSIDPNQNVWVDSTSTTLYVIPNTGSVATPTYATSATSISGITVNPTVGITFAGTSSSNYTAYVSGYNTTSPGIQPVTFTLGGANNVTVTSPSAGTATTAGSKILGSYYNQADGTGNIWLADVAGHAVVQYSPTGGTGYIYKPCVQIASNVCGATWGSLKPYDVSIDSTGSIWVPAPAVGTGVVVEIIGAAAPTWPLLSSGKLGKP